MGRKIFEPLIENSLKDFYNCPRTVWGVHIVVIIKNLCSDTKEGHLLRKRKRQIPWVDGLIESPFHLLRLTFHAKRLEWIETLFPTEGFLLHSCLEHIRGKGH